MNPPKIIGISGKIGSGKTCTAKYLKKYGYQRRSFADKLKQMISIFDSSDYKDKDWKSKSIEGWSCSRGSVLQKIGTNIRDINPDAWVDSLFNEWSGELISIDDVRYKNEVKSIKDRGGIVIRIERTLNMINDSMYAGRDPQHSSEISLDENDYDLIIIADDPDEIYECLNNFLNLN